MTGQRAVALALSAALAAVAIVGCSEGTGTPAPGPARPAMSEDAARPRRGGLVHCAFYKEPLSLSLIGKTDYYGEIVASLVTDSLVRWDENLEYRPHVAESWTIDPDGRGITFRLRGTARWHDGRPVTAEDVRATVEKIRDPATESGSYAPSFSTLAALEAPDPRTLRVRYTEARADALADWTVPLVPAHRVGGVARLLESDYARQPIGCGPFRLVEWRPGQEIRLRANDEYWGGRPHLDGIVFHVLPDDQTGLQALLQGQIDVLGLPPDLWRQASRASPRDPLRDVLYYGLRVFYVGWNQDGSNPFFGDPRVRRAMLQALDRRRFLDRVVGRELGRIAVTTYHPQMTWTDRSIEPWPYDPAESRRLLAAAGWRDGDGDGIVEREGRPFRFSLLVPSSTQELNNRMAVWIQQSLRAVGVDPRLEVLEFAAFQERRRAHRFEAAMASYMVSPVADQREIHHSSSRDGSMNYHGFADAEVDRLLDLGRRTLDTGERRRIYTRIQVRLHELQPIACLFHFASPVKVDARLRGVRSSPLDLFRFSPGPRAWWWAGAPARG